VRKETQEAVPKEDRGREAKSEEEKEEKMRRRLKIFELMGPFV
jgi:hypothetical protein